MRLFACKLWLWLCDLSFIRSLLSKMVRAVDQGKEEMRFGMLWLVSYCFLLRLPSEVRRGLCCLLGMLVCVLMLRQALPIRKCEPDSEIAKTSQSIIWREGDEICLRLLRRKNRQSGSRVFVCIGCDALGFVCPGSGSGVMRRKCSCCGAARSATCAVHTLWERFIAPLTDGEVPWGNVSPTFARTRLR